MPVHGSSPSHQYLPKQSPSPSLSSSRILHSTPTPTKLTSSHAQPTLAMSLPTLSPQHSSKIQPPSSPPPRPSSRSECLLRDTLVKDNTRRTSATSRARSRSPSMCSDCADDVFFQPALLFSSRRNSATSTSPSPHHQSMTFYVPDESEDSSYAQLLRARSLSDCKGYTGSHVQREKSSDESLSTSLPRSYVLDSEAAPHRTVLRKRLDCVLRRGMRQRQHTKRLPDEESSSASPPSLAHSLSNSCSNSQVSEKTHVSAPEGEFSISPYSSPDKGPRYVHSTSATYMQAPKPRTPQSQRDSFPWITTPLPPSPSFSTPSKKSCSSPYAPPSPHSPAILATFSSANAQVLVPVGPPQFDPRAASLACKEVPGYVSFASVAGLGAPPGVGDDDMSVKELQRGRRLGRWWIF